VLVRVVEDRPGHLSVTLTAGSIPGSFANVIRTIRFGEAVNATIETDGRTAGPGPFSVSPPGGVPTFTFGASRVDAGRPFTIPLLITDNYGDFPTLVGQGQSGSAPARAPTPPASVSGRDCVQRPNVQVQVAPDRPGRLKVIVTAASLPTAPGNVIWSIRFGAAVNATIDADSHVADPGPFVLAPANGAASIVFYVNRAQTSQSVTVPFAVVDYYGEFPTFVGGGPDAF
jgi:hypothetical protein